MQFAPDRTISYNSFMNAGEIIKVDNLTKTYGKSNKIAALNSLSLSIPLNEKVAIMGPSGSGKSTLLHILGGLDRPSSGHVIVDNQNTMEMSDSDLSHFRNKKVGLIFQSFNLQPYLTAVENVALPLILSGASTKSAATQAVGLLHQMNLYDKSHKFPSQLSGGEMQRVAIARALIHQPAIILADEPTANLDEANADATLLLLP